MLQPLSSLFNRPPKPRWDEADLRQLIQDFLRRQLHTDALYCDQVSHGVAQLRVGSSADHQAVQLRTNMLQRYVKQQADYDLRQLRIRTS